MLLVVPKLLRLPKGSTTLIKVFNQAKFDKNRKFRYMIHRNFWSLLPKIHFWRKDWGLSGVPSNFEILLILPYFFRSKVLSRFARGNSYSKFIILVITSSTLLVMISPVQLWWNTPKLFLIKKVDKLKKSLNNHSTLSRIWVTDTFFHSIKIFQNF